METRFTVVSKRLVVLFCFEEKPPKTQWDHAASAYPAKATSLSFAFTFCGTLPVNQSRTSYSTKIDPSSPPSTNLCSRGYCRSRTYPQVRWWRWWESHPRLSAFIVACQQLIIYLYFIDRKKSSIFMLPKEVFFLLNPIFLWGRRHD